MDYRRIALAAVVAWLVDALYGIVMWIVVLGDQFASYPSVFRPQEVTNAKMPIMLGAGLVAMFALALIYAKGHGGRNGVIEGTRFGLLLAVFTLCFVSVSMYGTLNIGTQLATVKSLISFFEMILIGVVIGTLYRPAGAPEPSHAAAGRFA